VEDHVDGTLRGDPGRYDRQPILPVTAFDARNGMDNGDIASTLQRKDSLNAEPLLALQAPEEAATLTRGNASAGVLEPGRRREDDDNLVVTGVDTQNQLDTGDESPTLRTPRESSTGLDDATPAVVVQEAYAIEPEYGQGADLKARETDVAPPLTSKNEGVPGYDRGVRVVEGFAQGHQGQLDTFADETPAITAAGSGVRNNSPMVYAENQDGNVYEHGDETPALQATQTGENKKGQPLVFTKTHGAADAEDAENWEESEEARTLNSMTYATDVVVEGADDVASTLKGQRGKGGGGVGPEETLIPEPRGFDGYNHVETGEVTPALREGHTAGVPTVFESRFARNGRGAPSDEVPPLKAQSGETGKGDGAPMVLEPAPEDEAGTLRQHPRPGSNSNGAMVVEPAADVASLAENQRREMREADVATALGKPSGHMGQGTPSVRAGAAVRRLTPVECERLQGLPDGWTAIDGGDTPDGPRYAALGDAVTVPVARWIVARLVRRERGLRDS
jgi:site-specific DNA-cytosine methylase